MLSYMKTEILIKNLTEMELMKLASLCCKNFEKLITIITRMILGILQRTSVKNYPLLTSYGQPKLMHWALEQEVL